MRLKLQLLDQSGRKNRDPESFGLVSFESVPDLKLAFLARYEGFSVQEVPFKPA